MKFAELENSQILKFTSDATVSILSSILPWRMRSLLAGRCGWQFFAIYLKIWALFTIEMQSLPEKAGEGRAFRFFTERQTTTIFFTEFSLNFYFSKFFGWRFFEKRVRRLASDITDTWACQCTPKRPAKPNRVENCAGCEKYHNFCPWNTKKSRRKVEIFYYCYFGTRVVGELTFCAW